MLAFRLSQADLIRERLEAITPEALDLSTFEMFQVEVSDIERATGLSMPAFRRFEVRAVPESLVPEAEGLLRPVRLIRSFADIVR